MRRECNGAKHSTEAAALYFFQSTGGRGAFRKLMKEF